MSAYLRPTSLADAARARRDHPDYVVLAGGTDLLVSAHHRPEPPGILDLFGLDELVGVTVLDGGAVRIGAGTTYRQLLGSDVVRTRLPALYQAAREVGALQIQSRGTLGGNMATSSPVGDTLPVLLALGAVVHLVSSDRTRQLPYSDFCTGYRQTVLADDELIEAVEFPAEIASGVQYWRKVGTRRAQSISKMMIAAWAVVQGGRIEACRIGLGAVADRPVRATATEAAVVGKAPTAELAERAAGAVAAEIKPIDDLRSTAEYRLAVARNLVAEFVAGMAH